MTRAVFLDRDGVINQKAPEGQYVTRWEDFHLLPGVVEGIALLNRAGFSVIVITNQRGIAKGQMTEADLEKMHERMAGVLAEAGAIIDGTYYCPHELEASCGCRKPSPGMLFSAARARSIELPASWMIGDSDIDVAAGRNAGCKTARLFATHETLDETGRRFDRPSSADIVASSLLHAIRQILQWEQIAACSFTTDLMAS